MDPERRFFESFFIEIGERMPPGVILENRNPRGFV
jgi:hypothetical protein